MDGVTKLNYMMMILGWTVDEILLAQEVEKRLMGPHEISSICLIEY